MAPLLGHQSYTPTNVPKHHYIHPSMAMIPHRNNKKSSSEGFEGFQIRVPGPLRDLKIELPNSAPDSATQQWLAFAEFHFFKSFTQGSWVAGESGEGLFGDLSKQKFRFGPLLQYGS